VSKRKIDPKSRKLSGIVQSYNYNKGDYQIFKIKTKEGIYLGAKGKKIKGAAVGSEVMLKGHVDSENKYGDTFEYGSYGVLVERKGFSRLGLYEFLTSDFDTFSQRDVNAVLDFYEKQDSTFRLFLSDFREPDEFKEASERLASLPGIKGKLRHERIKAFDEIDSHRITMLCYALGFSKPEVYTIRRKIKLDTGLQKILKEDPYSLLITFPTLHFHQVDRAAASYGFSNVFERTVGLVFYFVARYVPINVSFVLWRVNAV